MKQKGTNYQRLLFQLLQFGLGIAIIVVSLCSAAAQQPEKEKGGTGTKYAVLVGINDYPYVSPLSGCVNDIQALESLFRRQYGFRSENVRTLLNQAATRSAILNQLTDHIPKVQRGDLFVFCFSGHGTLFPDKYSVDQDETRSITPDCENSSGCFPKDTYDSALCPYDTHGKNSSGKPWENLILDDELYDIFSMMSKKGCLIIFMSDSCHSGTVGRGLVKVRSVPPDKALQVDYAQLAANRQSGSKVQRRPLKNYIVISSSRDEETSLEINKNGLFTSTLIDTISRTNPEVSYKTLISKVGPIVDKTARKEKNNGGGQLPQLDERFCRPRILEGPLFALPSTRDLELDDEPVTPPTPSPGAELIRFVARVTDVQGTPIPGAAIVVLRPGTPISRNYQRSDLISAGRSNSKGVFDSVGHNSEIGATVPPGVYRVKVVCPGYQTFEGDISFQPNAPGAFVYTFKLARE